jgi:hypothetical protein
MGQRPQVAKVWYMPAPQTLADDVEDFPGELVDPFAECRSRTVGGAPESGAGGVPPLRSPRERLVER